MASATYRDRAKQSTSTASKKSEKNSRIFYHQAGSGSAFFNSSWSGNIVSALDMAGTK
jgi:hypothetical protein